MFGTVSESGYNLTRADATQECPPPPALRVSQSRVHFVERLWRESTSRDLRGNNSE